MRDYSPEEITERINQSNILSKSQSENKMTPQKLPPGLKKIQNEHLKNVIFTIGKSSPYLAIVSSSLKYTYVFLNESLKQTKN